MFSPNDSDWTETQAIPWADVNSVGLMPRADLPAGVCKHHAELLAQPELTDPNVIVGWLTGRAGVPRSDMFVLVPVPDCRSGAQWIEMFKNAGVEITPTV
jgi:hypothetical protein